MADQPPDGFLPPTPPDGTLLPPPPLPQGAFVASLTGGTFSIVTSTRSITIEPEFNFFIPSSEFFINTPGVSVTEGNKSDSIFSEGSFTLLNKNSVPVYYKGLTFLNSVIRTDVTAINKIVNTSLNNVSGFTTNTYVVYKVNYRSFDIGTLRLQIPSDYYNNPGKVIYPFQGIQLSADYKIENLDLLNIQYFGKVQTAPTKRVGIIDFNFQYEVYTSNDMNPLNVVTQPLTISCYVVNTGYVVPSLQTNLPNQPLLKT